VILSLLTFNLGLLDLWPLHPSTHPGPRMQAIPDVLAACGADVIALQEVFSPLHRQRLRDRLRHLYPYACRSNQRRSILGTGLMVLSRYPITQALFHRQPSATSLVFERGALVLTVATPSGCVLPLVVVHLEPGAPDGPSRPRRLREAAVMLAAATAREGLPAAVLAGDFNCSPEVATDVYGQIVAAGYDDVHRLLGGAEEPTWDARNPLNQAGPHRTHPSQRIDHVFVPGGSAIRPVSSRIVFRDACAALPGGVQVPISDHYGLLVELEVSGSDASVSANSASSGKRATASVQ
jgi:endonuclease/exonuclease/phosphatase family metal-dependent hydrolase